MELAYVSEVPQSEIWCQLRNMWNYLAIKSQISGFNRIESVNMTMGIINGIKEAESGYIKSSCVGYKVTERSILISDYYKKCWVVSCPKHFLFVRHPLLWVSKETRTTYGTRQEKRRLFRSVNSSYLCPLHLGILNALVLACIFNNNINNNFKFVLINDF